MGELCPAQFPPKMLQSRCLPLQATQANARFLRLIDKNISCPQLQPRQQGQGFPSKQQEVLAEEISKQEIKQKLGKAGPEPSESEKQIAEGIAQKEIAIDTGKAAPLKFTEVSLP